MNPVSPHDLVFLQAKWPSANSYLIPSDPPVLVDTGAIALRHGRLISTALDAGQSKSGRLSS